MSLSIEERQLIELRIRNDAPSVVVAYVMWGFLGLISAHRFYLGRPRSAVLQILSWLTVIGGFIWWLYDAVMISAYIRDDKNALRASLIAELETEKRGGYAPARPATPPAPPPAAKAPAPAPETRAPLAEAAAMTAAAKPAAAAAGPAKVALPKPELVLDNNRARLPLTLDEAPLTLKREPVNLGDEPKASPALTPAAAPEAAKSDWAMAAQPLTGTAAAAVGPELAPEPAPAPEPEPEPAPVAEAGPMIPHPEFVDASSIEVYPRPQQPIDSLTALDEELGRGQAPAPTSHP